MYIKSEDFTNEFVESIIKHEKDVFFEKYTAEEKLIILETDRLRGKEYTQEMLCRILRARRKTQRDTLLLSVYELSEIQGFSAELLELIADIRQCPK